MFVWKEKITTHDELKKVAGLGATKRGSNRRATGLVPFPLNQDSQREVSEARRVRYQNLLISIEGKQSTCCLKVISPKRKSRAALLIFRGRVIGCIYGRIDLEQQLFGRWAFNDFLDDLALEDSIVDTYILPEALALASGSLFHGQVHNQHPCETTRQAFDFVHKHLVETEMPGCVVLKQGTDEVMAFIYYFGGKIVGVFTYSEGWKDMTYAEAVQVIEEHPAVRLSASKLNARNVNQVFEMSFSLTGLSESPKTYEFDLIPVDL